MQHYHHEELDEGEAFLALRVLLVYFLKPLGKPVQHGHSPFLSIYLLLACTSVRPQSARSRHLLEKFRGIFDRLDFASLLSEQVSSLLVIGELRQSRAGVDNPDAFVLDQIERVFVTQDGRARRLRRHCDLPFSLATRRFVVGFFDLHPGSSGNGSYPTLRISVDGYANGTIGSGLESHGAIRVELERASLRRSR